MEAATPFLFCSDSASPLDLGWEERREGKSPQVHSAENCEQMNKQRKGVTGRGAVKQRIPSCRVQEYGSAAPLHTPNIPLTPLLSDFGVSENLLEGDQRRGACGDLPELVPTAVGPPMRFGILPAPKITIPRGKLELFFQINQSRMISSEGSFRDLLFFPNSFPLSTSLLFHGQTINLKRRLAVPGSFPASGIAHSKGLGDLGGILIGC